MFKKLLSGILTLCFCFSISSVAVATYDDVSSETLNASERDKIIDVLRYVEAGKENYNLEDVNFEEIEIGNAIYAYECTDAGFGRIGEVYPLIADGQVVATAIKVDNSGYSIETSLAQAINKADKADIALVYDCNNCYIYDGLDFIHLRQSRVVMPNRASLNETRLTLDPCNLMTHNIFDTETLGYKNQSNSSRQVTQTYYSCNNVYYVTQNPYDYLCWAASIATILNCLNGTSETAPSISMKYFGTTYVKDEGISSTQAATFMRNKCNLSYSLINSVPSNNKILSDIMNNYPIFGIFQYTFGYTDHAATIYGVNLISGYISVMDPLFGVATAKSDGYSYSYQDPYIYDTVTLYGSISHT